MALDPDETPSSSERPPLERLARWVAPVLLIYSPMLLWFAAFKPGMMTNDSLNIWGQLRDGQWVDTQAPAYTAAMWLSRSLIDSPSLLTLVQAVVLAVGIAALARSVIGLGVPRVAVIAVSAIIAASPMVGGFAVTLWKDVPYTGFFLMLTARVVDLVGARLAADRAAEDRALRWMVPAVIGLVAMRQNGFLLVVPLAIVLMLCMRDRWRELGAAAVSAVALVIVLKTVVYPITGIDPPEPRSAIGTLLTDIAAVAYTEPELIKDEDRQAIEAVAPLEEWAEAYDRFGGCHSANWLLDEGTFNWEVINRDARRYRQIALDLARKTPALVVGNHLCLGAIAWKPGNEHTGGMFTLSRNIDPNTYGLRPIPLSKGLNEFAIDVLDWTDDGSVAWFMWRAPVWIYLAVAAAGVAALTTRRPILLLVITPLVAQQASVIAINFAQDARYMFGALIAAPILITVALRRPGSSAE